MSTLYAGMLGESDAPSGTCIYIPERGQAMGKVWQEREQPVCNIIPIRCLSNKVGAMQAVRQAAVVSEFLVCARGCSRGSSVSVLHLFARG